MVVDVVAMLAAAIAGQLVRFGNLWGTSGFGAGWLSYKLVVAGIVPLWVLAVALRGGYDVSNLGSGSDEYRRVVDASIRYLAVVAAASFALGLDVARGFVAVSIPLATAGALVGRFAARRWLHHRRAEGLFQRDVLVVGARVSVSALADRLAASPYAGIRVVAACVPSPCDPVGGAQGTVPIVGRPEDSVAHAMRLGVDGIVIADGTTFRNGALRRIAWQLEGTGIGLMVAPDLADVAGPRITVRPAAEVPLLHLAEPELNGWRRLTKAALDRVTGATLLVVSAPVLLVVAVTILVREGRPIFFGQQRVGQAGQEFRIWKFRTMSVDAEDRFEALRELNEADGPLFKIASDPRVSRTGRWLRRWSLDELPQLWNVVRGDMSLVGPRPPLPSEVEVYSDDARRRLLVKPGMTGLWQVSGRSGLSWDESIRLDLHYVENWSPSLDAVILARTAVAVVRGRGAC